MIKNVAIYARKSRGEDKDLVKQIDELVEFCDRNHLNYNLYSEIESGKSIEARPVFKKLLNDILKNQYEKVIITDIDRLGRGSLSDQEKIFNAFELSNTKLITLYPYNEYDLTDETDEFETTLYGFLGRLEYKQIKKRFKTGKQIGSRKGYWTNGKPPYPYVYNNKTKELDIDPENYKIYRRIIQMFIQGYTETDIVNYLNDLQILSPNNKKWSAITIRRLLEDETHLGLIITNKTEGSGHKNKQHKQYRQLPREQWKIAKGLHTPVKNDKEHEEILLKLAKNKTVFINNYPLSGLIVCASCRIILTLSNRNGKLFIKKCRTEGCPNKGGNISYLRIEILRQKEKLLSMLNKCGQREKVDYKNEIKQLEMIISNDEKAINRIHSAYESGLISFEKYKLRLSVKNTEISNCKNQINAINIYKNRKINYKEIETAINYILNDVEISDKKGRMYYQLIFKSIVWFRDESSIRLDFNYNL